MPDVGLPWEIYNWHQLEWYGKVNFLKGGLVFTDFVTTVSPTQAVELRTPGGGFGLHDVSAGWATGSSGSSTASTSASGTRPPTRRSPRTYSADHLEGKRRCKAALQRSFGLPQRRKTPALRHDRPAGDPEGTRPDPRRARPARADAQFVFLGSGEQRYEQALVELAALRARPHRRAARLHRPAGAPAHGGRRHLPHAVAVRALRAHPDARAALRRAADRAARRRARRHRRGRRDRLLVRRYTPDAFSEAAFRALDCYADPPALAGDDAPRRWRATSAGSARSARISTSTAARWPLGGPMTPADGLRPHAAQPPALRAQPRPLAARQRLALRGGARHLPPAARDAPRRSAPTASPRRVTHRRSRRCWPTSSRARCSREELEAFFEQRLAACDEAPASLAATGDSASAAARRRTGASG